MENETSTIWEFRAPFQFTENTLNTGLQTALLLYFDCAYRVAMGVAVLVGDRHSLIEIAS